MTDQVLEESSSKMMRAAQITMQLADYLAAKRREALQLAERESTAQAIAAQQMFADQLEAARPVIDSATSEAVWDGHPDQLAHVYGVCRRFSDVDEKARVGAEYLEARWRDVAGVDPASLPPVQQIEDGEKIVVPQVPGEEVTVEEWRTRLKEAIARANEAANKQVTDVLGPAYEAQKRQETSFMQFEEGFLNPRLSAEEVGDLAVDAVQSQEEAQKAITTAQEAIGPTAFEDLEIGGRIEGKYKISEAAHQVVRAEEEVESHRAELSGMMRSGLSKEELLAKREELVGAQQKAVKAWDTLEARQEWQQTLVDKGVPPDAARAAMTADAMRSNPVGKTVATTPQKASQNTAIEMQSRQVQKTAAARSATQARV